MTSFDHQLWLDRATKRYEDATRGSNNDEVRRFTQQYVEDVRHSNGLKTIIDWCNTQQLTVVFCKRAGGVLYPTDKEIKISGRASPRHQLHILLHECGHILIGDKEKHQRYGMGYASTSPAVKRSLHHRLDILDEEFEAWHRGWKLALREGVLTKSDKVEYDKTRIKMLRSYVLWAAKAPGYESYCDPEPASKKLQ